MDFTENFIATGALDKAAIGPIFEGKLNKGLCFMIRFISARKVQKKIQLGEKPVLLDISSEASFQKRHPRSAVNLPLEELKDSKRVHSYFPNQGKEIVIFAETHETEPAWEAAELLHKQGYDNLYIYEGGKAKWVEEGLPFQAVHYPPKPPEPGQAAVPPPSAPNISPRDPLGSLSPKDTQKH